ncbi:hypothetical protein ACHAP5_005285 [Fusarium lateritium]
MASFDDNGFPVVHLSNDGWSTEDEATATCFCGAVQLVLHLRGEDNLATFSEEKTIRANATMTNYFCKTCGTLMYRRGARFPGLTILRTGTVDDLSLAETKLKPQVEQFIERRAAWSKPIEGAAQAIGMHSPKDIEGIP